MEATLSQSVVDLATCASEPIHTPGLIQPHGMLLATDEAGLVSHVSANLSVPLCRDAASAIGKTLADVLGPDVAASGIQAADTAGSHLLEAAFVATLKGAHDQVPVLMSAHRHGGRIIVELEQCNAPEQDAALPLTWLYPLQHDMSLADGSRDIGSALAKALQRITQYDRVMVYEFDPDWHGHVVGEAQAATLQPLFVGLHFPATDIPEQARALYHHQLLRVVVDSHATGATLLTDARNQPLDLSVATLRSVSPIHLEYMRNMGVRASLVASILVGDVLWGLVVCHHGQPRIPSMLVRKASQFAAMLAGGVLSSLALAKTLQLTASVTQISDRIANRSPKMSCTSAVMLEFPNLTRLFGIDGLSVQIAGERASAGVATPHPAVWDPVDPVLLAERFPDAVLATMRSAQGAVGGALFRVDDTEADVVVLGRVEYARTVNWGGDPSKPAQVSAEHPLRLSPRLSFERWSEAVRGRARPFTLNEIAAIELLHQRLSLLVQAENEQKRRERANQTEQLTAIGLVAGGVAHDLNNLLGVISLNLDIAIELGDFSLSEPYILAALKAVDSGSHVTTALLSFARKQELKPVEIKPALMLQEFYAMAKVLLGSHISLEIVCPDDAGRCRADLGQLQTALLNLTVNGRDSMKLTGGIITISVRNVSLTTPLAAVGHEIRPGKYLAFSVADQGQGMPADVLRHATEPFFTTKSSSEGTGLGLPMVLGFAVQSDGALLIASEPGRGTTATILLPRIVSDQSVFAMSVPRVAQASLASLRLLLVEDRPDVSNVVQSICQRAGLLVTLTETAPAALEQLQSGAFDLVLSDVALGTGGSGFDVLARARSLTPPVPTLLMTGYNSGATDPDTPQPPPHEVLCKPFKARDLLEALETLARTLSP